MTDRRSNADLSIVLRYNEKHDHYYLTRGRETFYTSDRYMRTWETPEEAIIWSEEHLQRTPIVSEKP